MNSGARIARKLTKDHSNENMNGELAGDLMQRSDYKSSRDVCASTDMRAN